MTAACHRCGGSGEEPTAIKPLVRVEIPVRTVSEANDERHWRTRQRRRRAQHEVVTTYLMGKVGAARRAMPGFSPGAPSLRIRLTRIAPGRLDMDNLATSTKSVQDCLAEWLLVDDGHPGLLWEYAQERGKPRQYAVRIEIWAR